MSAALHHRVDGPPDALVVVLGASLGATLELWEPQAVALADRFRVLRFDHPGHGGSPVLPGPYTIDALAGEVLALLDGVGAHSAAYCGTSLGGMVGMALALRAPERVDRLVLACTSAHLGPPSLWSERAATVRAEGMAAIAPAVLGRWFTGATPPAVEAAFLACAPEGYARCCEAIGAHDLREAVAAIRAPTLVVAGADDEATPAEHLALLRDTVPGARLETIPDAAHQAAAERAEAFTALLEGFLAS
jgi:3-oxoadipate enol-lactonase